MPENLEPFLEHFREKDGFCRPDWEAIWDLAEERIPKSDWNTLYEILGRRWLDRLRITMGGDYRVVESENFLILSEASDRIVADAGRFYERAREFILDYLSGVAADEGLGKHVVLMFHDLEDYYSYLCYYYPEGEHPMSGGVFLRGEGYAHFAFPTCEYDSYRSTMVHELTHWCLSHLPVPLWMNEALAQRLPELLCGVLDFELDVDTREKHEEHWNEETIQQFWSGESWSIPGESFGLSYELAHILWSKLENDLKASHETRLEFVAAADYRDGGEEACRRSFGVGCGELVADFLGEGPWSPRPELWPWDEEDIPQQGG